MPKFTAKEDFLRGHTRFEAGNTYDSDKHDLTESDVKRFWDAGFCEVEGYDAAPDRDTSPKALAPKTAAHTQAADSA